MIPKIDIKPNSNVKKTTVKILEHLENMIGVSIDNWENPKKIKLLGIEAYGRDHEVELDIAKIKIF